MMSKVECWKLKNIGGGEFPSPTPPLHILYEHFRAFIFQYLSNKIHKIMLLTRLTNYGNTKQTVKFLCFNTNIQRK